METVLWIVIIFQWILYVYLPIVCFIGLIMTLANEDPDSCVPNLYFGIIKASKKKGVLIWCIRLVLLGAVLLGYANWYYNGENPFIQL